MTAGLRKPSAIPKWGSSPPGLGVWSGSGVTGGCGDGTAEETLQRIGRRLDESRVIGTRVLVEPPVYRGVTVVAKLKPRAAANPTRLQADALEALYNYFHPISGGPDRNGWPFGRPVHVGEVYSVLQALRGTELVEDARLFGADPTTGQRGQAVQRLQIEPHALVYSYEHQVMVEGA